MKILHINTSDINGGAARAVYRLHQALLTQGCDSQMLVQKKAGDDLRVIGPYSKVAKGMGFLRPFLDQLPIRLYPDKKKLLFSPSWLPFSGIIDKIEEINPDIVHLHWIAGGFIRIEQLAKIHKPIIWSLHDMWAFTGGCHYDDGCGKYSGSCCSCPGLVSQNKNDISRWVFHRKQKTFSKIASLTINGLSRWLADCASSSTLMKNRRVVNLPNPIDCQIYKPLPKEQAKKIIGLPVDKKSVLFGALNPTGDDRKGFAELVTALQNIQTDNIELTVFGSREPADPFTFSFPARYMGRLQDDVSLKILYSAADVMVLPSRQENLSNAIMEALACGTPVAGFNIGGNKDMIDHKMNGFLATPFDPKDLAQGIDWVLKMRCKPEAKSPIAKNKSLEFKTKDKENKTQQNGEFPFLANMGRKAREKVVRNFDSQVVAKKYIELYEEISSPSGRHT